MDRSFQRVGSKSNTDVGRKFEQKAKIFFASKGLNLQMNLAVEIGIKGTKPHRFDLGCDEKKILVECKSHTWTKGGNVPSAKITTWDQAMYMFVVAPPGYQKIFFVLRDYNQKKSETLAEFYLRTKSHLIPSDVEIWEFDESTELATKLN